MMQTNDRGDKKDIPGTSQNFFKIFYDAVTCTYAPIQGKWTGVV